MSSAQGSQSSAFLSSLAESLSHLDVVLPESPQYPQLRETYIQTYSTPLAIVRPTTAHEVATIVSIASAHKVKFTVRAGGHNLEGRCIVQDALAIDLRLMNHVHVAADKSTATIGGGILEGDLVDELAKHNLTTPFGSIPSIGHVGWATFGGYGHLSKTHGLGVDQILRAKVVNYKAEVVEASEEMLKGIRGGGGNLGIIVDMTVKVYPFQKVSRPVGFPCEHAIDFFSAARRTDDFRLETHTGNAVQILWGPQSNV